MSAVGAVPPLVGRSAELARVTVRLERAAGGQGGMLMVAGASGIGKTRLTSEILTLARDAGWTVLTGGARVLGSRQGYALWLEVLAPYLAGLPQPERTRLVDGLPDLGRLLAGLHLAPPVPLLDAALERTRLFEAVARLLVRIADRGPVTVALDDLHWSDPGSIELLHYAARGLADRPVLVIGTYRTDEAEATPELFTMLRDLSRDDLVDEIRLSGLDAAATRALAASMLGGDPPEELVTSLVARTVGSPFMVTALVEELRSTGELFRSGGAWVVGPGALRTVPAVVGDLARARLRRLDPAQRTVVELVAVAGAAATVPVLADAYGTEIPGAGAASVLAAARDLAEVGLLAEEIVDGTVRYRTTHPVYAEVAYAGQPESLRRHRHAVVAAALERRYADDVRLLAPHYLGAHDQVDPERALAVLRAAGNRALAAHAGAEAVDLLAAARGVARARGDAALGITLAEQLGDAWYSVRRIDPAVEAWSEALDGHRRAGDTEAVARVARHLADALWDSGEFDRTRQLVAEALAADQPAGPASELLRLRETALWLALRTGDMAEADAHAAELRAQGRRLGSNRATLLADLFEAAAQRDRGEYDAARRVLLDRYDAIVALDDPLLLNMAQRPLILIELALAGPPAALRRGAEAMSRARASAVLALEVSPRTLIGIAHFFAGEWEDSLRAATELLAVGHRIASPRAVAAGLSGRALVLCHRGELAAAAQCLAEARSAFGGGRPADRHIFSHIETLDMMVALHRDPGGVPGDAPTAPGLLLAELTLAVHGHAQLAAGDVAAAATTRDRLTAVGPGAPFSLALADRLTASIHRARGDGVAAREMAARAAAGFTGLHMPFEAARCWLEWAGDGDRPGAVDAVQKALRVFVRLGARHLADQARHRLRALGAAPAPADRSPRPAGDPLSPREREVVQLVAAGLGNAEIARRLVISPRTVTTHLQHVYARLGLGSRAALVRYALDHAVVAPARIRSPRRPGT